MTIEAKLKAALAGISTVTFPGLTVWPVTMPQQPTYPAVVYQLIAEAPADSITQLARFTDFHFQISIHAADYPTVVALRSAVLTAAEAMPECITRLSGLEPPYEFEPKTYTRIVTYHFRDAES